METENVRKQLKVSQNIGKMLWCIGNANINIQSISYTYGHLFKSCTKNQNRFFQKTEFAYKFSFFLNFSVVFHRTFENYWKNF